MENFVVCKIMENFVVCKIMENLWNNLEKREKWR